MLPRKSIWLGLIFCVFAVLFVLVVGERPNFSTPASQPIVNVPPSNHVDKTFGTLEVYIGNTNLVNPKPLRNTGIQIVRSISGGFLDFLDDNLKALRYFWRTLEFENTSSSTWSILTFYAYHQTNKNLGGTAFNTLMNDSLEAITDEGMAQSIRPSHGMKFCEAVLQVNPSEADFQGFLSSEARSLQAIAIKKHEILATDQILEYGFVLRNVNGGRQVKPKQRGQVTFGFLFPLQVNSRNNLSEFRFTVEIANEKIRRVTRSPEESTPEVLARAATQNATQVFLTGLDGDTALPLVTSLRHVRLRTSIAPDLLDEQIQKHIEPSITGLEREYIAEHMRDLPSSEWKDVIYINKVNVYVNREELRGMYNLGISLGGNVYRDPATGEVYVASSPEMTGGESTPTKPQCK